METELERIFDKVEAGLKALQLLNLYKTNHAGSTSAHVKRNLRSIDRKLPLFQAIVAKQLEGMAKAMEVEQPAPVARPEKSLLQRLGEKMRFKI